MSDKQVVVKLLKQLPANVKLRKITKEIQFLSAVREGEEQADRGEVISHEEIKREFSMWLSK